MRAALALVAVAALTGCAVGNPYRAEPIDPDIQDAMTTHPVTEIAAEVDGGLLLIRIERTSRKSWKERPVFRERRTRYSPLADAAEFLFFPIGLVGYIALSPALVPLDAMGRFTSYVDGYPDPRPWAMIETLATGWVPGVTTHYYDDGPEAGQPTGGFWRGDWHPGERWLREPVGQARLEVQAPDGSNLAFVTADEAGHGALYLRNYREAVEPFYAGTDVVRLRVVFGGTTAEVPVAVSDFR